jgi:hypothetical protein
MCEMMCEMMYWLRTCFDDDGSEYRTRLAFFKKKYSFTIITCSTIFHVCSHRFELIEQINTKQSFPSIRQHLYWVRTLYRRSTWIKIQSTAAYGTSGLNDMWRFVVAVYKSSTSDDLRHNRMVYLQLWCEEIDWWNFWRLLNVFQRDRFLPQVKRSVLMAFPLLQKAPG